MTQYIRKVLSPFHIWEHLRLDFLGCHYPFSNDRWYADLLNWAAKDDVIFAQPKIINDEWLRLEQGFVLLLDFNKFTTIIGKVKNNNDIYSAGTQKF